MRCEVDVNDFLNIFWLTFAKRYRTYDSSIVDENVDGAQSALDVFLKLLDAFEARDVDFVCCSLDAVLGRNFGGGNFGFFVVDVGDDYVALFAT